MMKATITVTCLCAALASAQPQNAPSLAGAWQGELHAGAVTLRLRINLSATPTGDLTATLDSIDQGANGIPVKEVAFANGKLTWSVPQIRASYEGVLNDKGDLFSGTFTQGAAIPLDLKRLTPAEVAASKPKRPQDPKPPFPYRAEDVTFPSKAPGIQLAGTLTIPAGPGPHPALVLVTGSGPQDRDEALLGHRPFAVIADHLSRNGVAVLRFDDRGIAKSGGKFAGATTADFALDAEGAFEYLLTRTELAHDRSGVGGHSEGAIIAPIVAGKRKDVAFLVMLAGTGVNGEQVILAQSEAILRASSAPAEALAKQRKTQDAMLAVIKSDLSPADAEKQLSAQLSGPELKQILATATDPWFRYFVRYDPAPALEKVQCPVLVLQGDLDLQVLPDQNLPPIRAAFAKGGNTKVVVERLPKLNHLFQTATTGSPSEYAKIEETTSPVMLDSLTAWLRRVGQVK